MSQWENHRCTVNIKMNDPGFLVLRTLVNCLYHGLVGQVNNTEPSLVLL